MSPRRTVIGVGSSGSIVIAALMAVAACSTFSDANGPTVDGGNGPPLDAAPGSEAGAGEGGPDGEPDAPATGCTAGSTFTTPLEPIMLTLPSGFDRVDSIRPDRATPGGVLVGFCSGPGGASCRLFRATITGTTVGTPTAIDTAGFAYASYPTNGTGSGVYFAANGGGADMTLIYETLSTGSSPSQVSLGQPTAADPYLVGGTTPYFSVPARTGTATLYVATVSPTVSMSTPVRFVSTSVDGRAPVVSDDQLELFSAAPTTLAGTRHIATSTRAAMDLPFGDPQPVDALNGNDPAVSSYPSALSSDSCTLYVIQERSDGTSNMAFAAHRTP